MENARKFLARAVPWPTGQDDWWISIHWGWQREGRKGISFGRAFKDLNRAASLIEFLRDNKGSDMYVCMSGLSVVEQRTSKTGRPQHVASRLAQNAAALRSLWLDVDVKAKGFASTEAALDAFGVFLKASGMPAPTYLVMTGSGGFHVHWVLEDPITPAEWLPLAHALVVATRHFVFIPLDTAVVTNPVCLLRVPDTFNWKTDPPKQVWMPRGGKLVSIDKIRSVLAPFLGLNNVTTNINETLIRPGQSVLGPAFPVKAPLPFDRRQAYPELSFQGTIDDVAVTCKFIADGLETHGEGLNEPVWFESLQVAYYTSDPHDAAHRLSLGHVGYDPDETDEKLAHIEKDRQRRDLGWPQCTTIHAAGATQCPSCPHFGKGQSPLNFVDNVAIKSTADGVLSVTKSDNTPEVFGPASAATSGYSASTITLTPPPVVRPDYFLPLPLGYFEDPEHYVFKPEETKANEVVNVPVAGLPMWNFWAQEPLARQGGAYAINFRTRLNARTEKEIHLPYTSMSDLRSMLLTLGEQGFHVDRLANAKWFGGLMTAFINMLKAQNRIALPCEDLGWSYDKGERSAFVYSRVRFNCSGNTPVSHADRQIDQEYTQVGTFDRWQQAAKLITDQKLPALNAILAASFAAPLVAPCGYSGMVLSAYSLETGVSKTAAMRVAQAVWSNPDVTPGLIDTANYVNDRLGRIRHLPFFYDELRMQSQTAQFVNMMFAMGQGKSKGRLNRQSVSQPVSTFATLILVASNNGIVDYVTKHTQMTTAGIHRLFEFVVPRNTDQTGMIDGATAQQVIADLGHNFGHAGLPMAQYLGQNAAKVDKHVGSLNKHLMERLKAAQEERFWAGTIAVLIMGARYANDLKLVDIDDTALTKFLLEQFELQREQRHGSRTDVTKRDTIRDYLAIYIGERRQQTIVTQRVWTAAGRPPTNFNPGPIYDQQKIQGRIALRAATEDKVLRIAKHDFAEWLEKRGLQARPIFDRMRKVMAAKQVYGAVGSHTAFKTAREELFEFDLSKEDLIDFT